MNNSCEGNNCGNIEVALETIAGKWKLIILFHLMSSEVLRFSELQRAIPTISKKMLTSQLRELEYDDIINRKVYQQVPPKVEYSMTEYGKELIPILVNMRTWGQKHMDHMDRLYGEDYKLSHLKKEG